MFPSSLRAFALVGALLALTACPGPEERPDGGGPTADSGFVTDGGDAGDAGDAGADGGQQDGGRTPVAFLSDAGIAAILQWECAVSACASARIPALDDLSCRVLGIRHSWSWHREEIESGRMREDVDAIDACVEALSGFDPGNCLGQDGGLSVLDAARAHCEKILQPAVVLGGECLGGGECLEGYCPAGTACPRTCVAQNEAGGPCAPGVDACATGLRCGANATCVAEGSAGAACEEDAECGEGLDCVKGRCATAPEIGAACRSSSDCAGWQYCSGNGPWAGTCRARGQAGDPCDFTGPITTTTQSCLGNQACPGFHRGADGGFELGTCAAPGGVGTPCDPDAVFANGCLEGLRCDFGTRLCAALPSAGQPCFQGVHCGVGTSCTGGTCVAKPGPGSPCSDDFFEPCDVDAYCDPNNICRALKPAGETCGVFDDDCASGSCDGFDRVCRDFDPALVCR